MLHKLTRQPITYEGTMVTLMTTLLLLAVTLLIVGGILVSYAEAYIG